MCLSLWLCTNPCDLSWPKRYSPMYHKYLNNSCVGGLACPLLCLLHEHTLGLNFWRKRNTMRLSCSHHPCQHQLRWVSCRLTHFIHVSPAQDRQSCLDGHSAMWTVRASCSRPQRFVWLTVTQWSLGNTYVLLWTVQSRRLLTPYSTKACCSRVSQTT